ncbi:flagellar assembly protein T N-terminal domain-containing protein [Neptuniibacter sp. QD37_6]|uniref:flagellar assembly protein T N-terminal domain-containing protein n=1 Tax=Neptuniibacter sp. QD37_6 TaxID=3398210 RepID=UPI0039F57F25
MFNLAQKLVLACLLLLPVSVQAVIVEAEGQANIANKDISSAREAAIRDASQQASMQAAVYVSSSQVVRDGILEIDNMQISTLGQVSNIEIVDEKVIGNTLFVRIRADVLVDQGCYNGVSNSYTKSIAIAAFPLLKLKHANLGGLSSVSSDFPAQIAQLMNKYNNFIAHNAGRLNLYIHPSLAPTNQLDYGALSSMQQTAGQLNVNYIVSGVIRDMSMMDPRTHAEKNYVIDLYNQLDYKSKKHLRNFEIDLYIHDGLTGHLVHQKHYQTAGFWNLDRTIKTGFNTASFFKQDFGQKVQELQQTILKDLQTELHCEPFTTLINHIEDRTIWINSGKQQGLKRGDKLTIYRKSTYYSPNMEATTQLINTKQTLVIDDVQMGSASGYISSAAASFNIRPGDLAIAR